MSTLEWGQNDPPSLTLGLKELNTIHLRIVLFSVCSKVRFDFEEGAASLKDWGRTGTAFNYQPQYGGKIGPKVNRQGDYWITSGDLEQGTLVSPEFEITGLNFMSVLFIYTSIMVRITRCYTVTLKANVKSSSLLFWFCFYSI